MSDLVVGRIYRVHHARKGTFTAKLLALVGNVTDGYADVEIVDGTAKCISVEVRDGTVGEVIRVSMSLARFEDL